MRIVVVGGGLAGIGVCRELRAAKYQGEIVLLDQETERPYDRPPLSKQLLQGRAEPDDLALLPGGRLAEWGVTHRLGAEALGLDRDAVTLTDGSTLPFDGLVIATGAAARRLPDQPDCVHVLRTLADALALRADLATARQLVVIGGGFIGLEVAASAAERGIATTVVEREPIPLAHAIGPEAGTWLTELHREHGVSLRCGADVVGFAVADGRVRAVELADGMRLSADVVLVGVGARPSTDWLTGSGLPLADGILCDAGLRAAPKVYAAGDVARWRHPVFGPIRAEHWTTAVDHARTVAANLTAELNGGDPARQASEVAYFWTDQYDVKLQLAGWVAGYDRCEVVGDGRKRAILYGRGDALVGVLGVNHPAFVARHRKAIAAGITWDEATSSLKVY